MTPRVLSPAVSKPRLPKKKTSLITNTKLTNRERLESDLPNLTSRRHQAPPGLHLGSDSDSESNDVSKGATHRVLKPNTGGGASPGSNIRKPLKRYGVESQDRGEYFTRQSGYSRNSREENIAPKRSDRLQNKQGLGNDSRTRSTLDSLLRDADESAHDLLANVPSGGRKMEKNDVNSSRQKVGLNQRTVLPRGLYFLFLMLHSKQQQRTSEKYFLLQLQCESSFPSIHYCCTCIFDIGIPFAHSSTLSSSALALTLRVRSR